MHREVQTRAKVCYAYNMTELMEKALAVMRTWPLDRQDEAAQMLVALDRIGGAPYQASEDELRAIDQALAQVRRGELATDRET